MTLCAAKPPAMVCTGQRCASAGGRTTPQHPRVSVSRGLRGPSWQGSEAAHGWSKYLPFLVHKQTPAGAELGACGPMASITLKF